MFTVALRATRRDDPPVAAKVALQPLPCTRNVGFVCRWLVVCECNGAVLAFWLFAARPADDGKGIAAPIQQNQRLLAPFESRAGLLNQRPRKKLFLARLLKFAPHVDQ